MYRMITVFTKYTRILENLDNILDSRDDVILQYSRCHPIVYASIRTAVILGTNLYEINPCANRCMGQVRYRKLLIQACSLRRRAPCCRQRVDVRAAVLFSVAIKLQV